MDMCFCLASSICELRNNDRNGEQRAYELIVILRAQVSARPWGQRECYLCKQNCALFPPYLKRILIILYGSLSYSDEHVLNKWQKNKSRRVLWGKVFLGTEGTSLLYAFGKEKRDTIHGVKVR